MMRKFWYNRTTTSRELLEIRSGDLLWVLIKLFLPLPASLFWAASHYHNTIQWIGCGCQPLWVPTCFKQHSPDFAHWPQYWKWSVQNLVKHLANRSLLSNISYAKKNTAFAVFFLARVLQVVISHVLYWKTYLLKRPLILTLYVESSKINNT